MRSRLRSRRPDGRALHTFPDPSRAARTAPPTIRRDHCGNALGGIRLPDFAVPTGEHRGNIDGDIHESLPGYSRPFSAAGLHEPEQLHARPLIVDMEAAEAEWEHAPGRLVRGHEVLLTPGNRVDLAAGSFQASDELASEGLPYSRGMIKEHRLRYATIRVERYRPSRVSIPSTLCRIEPLAPAGAAPTRTIHLGGRRSLPRGVDFFINDEVQHHVKPVRVGELQIWDIVNDTTMDHPFHLHGFFFQLRQVNSSLPQVFELGRQCQCLGSGPDPNRSTSQWPGGRMYHLPHPRTPRRRNDGLL